MGKTSKWLRSFLTGKKCTTTPNSSPPTPISLPPTTPKDKKRWSFRRSHSAAKPLSSADQQLAVQAIPDSDNEPNKHVMAMPMEKATYSVEDAAATKIQASFRSHLARKALYALRGLVKLQALVRGHLVRKQASATLRCMEALVIAQCRARAQRIQTVEEERHESQRPSSAHRRSMQDRFRLSYNNMKRELEENIKIVEMDHGEFKGESRHRNSYSNRPPTTRHGNSKQDDYQISPSPSALTDMSPRGCTTHFKDYGFNTAQNSPQYAEPLSYDYSFFPNYMANTESSRAKARSQSAPKQRTAESFERPAIRRKASIEGRNVPRAVRMQRSSSHVGATAQNYQYPWSMKLDQSTVSMVDSECGSNSTVLTNNYCRSVAGYM